MKASGQYACAWKTTFLTPRASTTGTGHASFQMRTKFENTAAHIPPPQSFQSGTPPAQANQSQPILQNLAAEKSTTGQKFEFS